MGIGFHTWQVKLKGYLMKKGLWGVVKPMGEGETVQTRANTTQFQAKDEQALGIIITSLDDNFVHYLDECTTAFNAWQTLERLFGAKAKHSKISLKMQLYGLIMGQDEDLSSLINRLKSICTQLVYIQSPVEEEDQIAVLLKALPQEYDQIVTVLKEKDPIPSLESVINSLQEEDKKINKGDKASTSNGVYAVTTSKKGRCIHCKKTNHASKDCFSIKPCTKCGKTGHPPFRCFNNNEGRTSNDRGKAKINLVKEEDEDNPEASSSNGHAYFTYDDVY